MDAGLFIYFTMDPGQNIYLKVYDGHDIDFSKMPLRLPIVPTAILNAEPCHTGFGLVILNINVLMSFYFVFLKAV